jgi:hypothetical protein
MIMSRRSIRLLAIVLMLAVCVLGLHAALHWHGPNYDNCQACHSGRVAISQPAIGLGAQTPILLARFTAPESPRLHIDPVCSHRIPRAPPA